MSINSGNDVDDDASRQSENFQDEESSLKRQNSIKWRVRPMRLRDIDKCLVIWRQVDLTEAHQTVASSLVTDPQGFYVAELESNGEVIGMCSGIMARPDTAFMGFYAVDPDYQGIGVGRELWAKTLERLDSSVNVGLYGVPAMSEKYKKSGFKLEDTIRMLIFESQPGQELRLDLLQDLAKDDSESSLLELELINGDTSELLVKKLIDYDAFVNKSDRNELLRNYLTNGKSHDSGVPLTLALVRRSRRRSACSCNTEPQEVCSNGNTTKRLSSQLSQEPVRNDKGGEEEALSSRVRGSLSISASNTDKSSSVTMDLSSTSSLSSSDVDEQHIELLGYGCIRDDNTDGGMIGPLYANTGDFCEIILKNLLLRFKLKLGGKYSVMSLTSNEQAANILNKIGLQEMDQCSRMFTNFVPVASTDKIFYIHSPNFTLF